jgi:hypothetical protein
MVKILRPAFLFLYRFQDYLSLPGVIPEVSIVRNFFFFLD